MEKVLLTGSSTGLGFDAARYLIQKGYSVYAGVRNTEDGEKLSALGATPIQLDVTSQDDVNRAFSELSQGFRSNDRWHLINNAGISIAGPIELVPVEEFQRQFEVNFFGVIRVTQKFLPWIRQQKGRIINIGSISGRLAIPFVGPYSSSKFALDGLSDALRRELLPLGVHVSMVNPGPIKTPIWGKTIKQSYDRYKENPSFEVYREKVDEVAELAAQARATADEPILVSLAIHEALTAKRPKARYYVGSGVPLQAKLSHWASDRLLDKLILYRYRARQKFGRAAESSQSESSQEPQL